MNATAQGCVDSTTSPRERARATGPERVGAPDADARADHAWRRFCQRLGYALDFLREHNPVARALPRGPWAILQALAPRWHGKREAYPSQEWIARYTGYCVRVVREDIRELERTGVIELRRERQPDGHERIVYVPGRRSLPARSLSWRPTRSVLAHRGGRRRNLPVGYRRKLPRNSRISLFIERIFLIL